MGWTVFTWIFGVIAVIGPLLLIGWYLGAAREQVRRMKQTDEPPRGPQN